MLTETTAHVASRSMLFMNRRGYSNFVSCQFLRKGDDLSALRCFPDHYIVEEPSGLSLLRLYRFR